MTDQKMPVPDSDLRSIASLTALMRHKEQELADIAERRRVECVRLAAGSEDRAKVTYARLAKAMGISDVAVYKILKKGGGKLRDRAETIEVE